MRSEFQFGRMKRLHRSAGEAAARRLGFEIHDPEAMTDFRRRRLQIVEEECRRAEVAEMRRLCGK